MAALPRPEEALGARRGACGAPAAAGRAAAVVAALATVVALSGCGGTGPARPDVAAPTRTPAPPAQPTWPSSPCPTLAIDPAISALDGTPDGRTYAQRIGVDYAAGRVLLTITLRGGEDGLVAALDLQPEILVAGALHTYLEAYAPVGRLCELARDPRVFRIDRIERGHTGQAGG